MALNNQKVCGKSKINIKLKAKSVQYGQLTNLIIW